MFRHPKTGIQFVRGNIKPNEKPKFAALRELHEESGIKKVSTVKFLGAWRAKHRDQIWYFYKCRPAKKLKQSWEFFCEDDGGHLFEFFWFKLNQKPDKDWRPIFMRAFKHVKKLL